VRVREEVPAALAGERLDRVVSMVAGISRAEASAKIDAGEVLLSGRVVTARTTRVAEGDAVELDVVEPDPTGGLEPDATVEVPVLHEDADLIVIDKPAGLVVHPGAGQRTGTLASGLLARFPEIAEVRRGRHLHAAPDHRRRPRRRLRGRHRRHHGVG
jgi:23S rRNA pseudouridine1911/1915/1917 synthase